MSQGIINIDQEIEWLREEIDQDLTVINSGTESSYQKSRMEENQRQLDKLLEERG